jgi:hypothetical protein
VVHDSSYSFHHRWTEAGLVACTQKEADDLLYIGMRAEGCNKWLAAKAWAGVRAAGWSQWPKTPITIANALRLESATGNPLGTVPESVEIITPPDDGVPAEPSKQNITNPVP